jgi:octanoyl-[GcvH]:protein N-octanoyltransferase
VTDVFEGAFELIDDTGLPVDQRSRPQDHAAWVKQTLASLQPGDNGVLRFRRPRPTAAFSPQDTTHSDYERVKDQARANGFEPIERGTGGRLTMFDEHALAITLIAPHTEPQLQTMKRFEVFAGVIAGAIKALDIDARIGELPNEYCPGKYSINAAGRLKLVGIAQRMNRRCFQMGAIIAVERSDKACAAITDAYAVMGLPFDPATYGAITELVPSITYGHVCEVLRPIIATGLIKTITGE